MAQITLFVDEAQSKGASTRSRRQDSFTFYARCGLRGCRYFCSINWAPCKTVLPLLIDDLWKTKATFHQFLLRSCPVGAVTAHLQTSSLGDCIPWSRHFPQSEGGYKRLVSTWDDTVAAEHTVVTWITSNACGSERSKISSAPHGNFHTSASEKSTAWNYRSFSTRSSCRWRPKPRRCIRRKSIESGDAEDWEAASVRSAARMPFYERNKLRSSR